jgi:hypothetical protein
MNDPVLTVLLILVLLVLGIVMLFWSKNSAMWEAKFNLWPWYKFFPGLTTSMYGKKENLENSFAIKLTTWWYRVIGIVVLLFALFLIVLSLGQL